MQNQVGGVLDRTLSAVFDQLPTNAQRDQALPGTVPAERTSATTFVEPAPQVQTSLALRYYNLRAYRLSDVSAGIPQGLFNIGSPAGFNLLDGPAGFLYVGFFMALPQREVTARTILLYQALDQIWGTAMNSGDATLADARRLFEQLSIELIVADDLQPDEVLRPLADVRSRMIAQLPEATIIRVSDIDALIEHRLNDLGA